MEGLKGRRACSSRSSGKNGAGLTSATIDPCTLLKPRGTQATISVTLNEACQTNSFCRAKKKRVLVGRYAMQGTQISPLMALVSHKALTHSHKNSLIKINDEWAGKMLLCL